MRKKTFHNILLTALLVLLPFFSSSADAALGDFQYKWGEVYNFQNPRGIAVDSSGNVYVANTGISKIEVFSSTGTFLRAWGSYGSGDGQFEAPAGVTVDSSGNVYVIDSSRRNVQVFSNTGTFLRKWGTFGTGDGQFYNPSCIAVDSSGNVYVLDWYRVQVFSSSGAFLRKWGSQGTGDGQFSVPSGIAVDTNGNVYVIDAGVDGVKVFTNTGTFLRKWGATGTGDGQFMWPSGIAVDSNGNVYVVDVDNKNVQVFTSTGTFLRKWGSRGSGDGRFMAPWAIAVNSSDNVYVLDFSSYTANKVQIFDSTGTFIGKWTNNGTGDGQFNNPGCVAVDSSGNVFVTDTQNNRVQVFGGTGAFLRKWGSQFNFPAGIAVGGSGNVYVTDYMNHRIQVFSNTGAFLRKWGTLGSGDGQLNYPWGIAVDGNENVYVVNWGKQHVQVFSSTGTFLRKFGSTGSGNGQFSKPSGIALDTSGNVYVVDYNNANVQVFSNAGAFLRKWGSYGSGDGQFSNPRGIAVDSSGNVYVADTYNHRVQVFSNTGAFLGKWGAYGSGDGQLNYPWGMAVDGNGHVFVADFKNNRVQVFEGILSCALTADAGPDQTVEQMSPTGASVVLNGTSTAQGCSGAVTYEWTWPGGSATGANPSVLMPPGTTNITLTVTNDTQTTTDAVVVAVRDTQAPSTTTMTSGIPGTNGWYVSDVAVALSASDTGSGVREIRYSISGTETVAAGNSAYMTISTEGTHTVTYFAVDNAANWETAHPMTINIDKTLPTIAASANSAPNGNGWYNTDVVVGFTCDDAVSGVASCTLPVTVATEGQNQAVTGTAADYAGNSATASINLNIDKTPPTITATVSPAPNATAWNNTDVTVTFTCTDTGSGTASCPPPATITTEGPGQVISGTSIDMAGNSASAAVTVNIDRTLPTITASASPAPNADGWNNTDVNVTFACADTGSGIASCPALVTAAAEGPNQQILGSAADKAGNTATASVTLNIDKTPPAIAITGINSGAIYVVGAVPSAGYSVMDSLSGMASQNATLTGGNANGVGTYSYTATALNRAGNAAQVTATYSVVYNFSGFLAPVSLGKPFKLRSTIPVKFQLTSSSGGYISTASAAMTIQKYSDAQPVGDPIEVTSTSGADTGNLFRYSLTDNLYIYNLSTDGLSEGTWQIRATLDDGTVKTAFIYLKAN